MSERAVADQPNVPGQPSVHGVRFDPKDASASLVIYSLGVIAGGLIVTFIIVIGMYKYFIGATPLGRPASDRTSERVLPPEPKLEVHPWESLPILRQHEDEILNGYGKDAEGHVHIPIDRAMDLVIPQLRIRPNSPPGLTIPGGVGFGTVGSSHDLPPQYRSPAEAGPPQLKGKVEKSAQQ